MDIKKIVKKHSWSVTLVLAFILIENIASLIEPSLFGKLLDALVDDFYHRTKKKVDYIFPLILWMGVYSLNAVGGSFSSYFSGKVYAQMYVDIATDVIVYSNTQGHSATRAMARAELAKEYIIFLKIVCPNWSGN